MGMIKEEIFCEILENPQHKLHHQLVQEVNYCNPNNRPYSERYDGYGNPIPDTYEYISSPVNREAALEVLGKLKARVCQNGSLGSKSLRPYVYDRLEYLDRSQTWWGFEFECGFRSREARAEAVAYAWDIADGVSFDGEGEGSFVSEVTFTPSEESKYLDGQAPAYRFMQWCNDHPDHMHNTGRVSVGTHLNISDPAMNPRNITTIARALNNSIHHLPVLIGDRNTRMEMFGRSSIYAGAIEQQMNQVVWIECKTFRTAYSMDAFQRYIRAGQALSKAVRAIAAYLTDGSLYSNHLYVSNLYEMYQNPEVEPIIASDVRYGGSYSSSWISNPSEAGGAHLQVLTAPIQHRTVA